MARYRHDLGPVEETPLPWSSDTDSTKTFIQGFTGAKPGPLRSYRPSPGVLDRTSPRTRTDAQGRELGLTVAQPGDPIPYVFGRVKVTPIIIAAAESGGYLYVDYLISQGEIEEIEKVFIGNEEQDSLPSEWEYYTGTSGQAASTLMKAAINASPYAYDALANIAHVVAKLRPTDSFDVKFQVKGLKLYDPRLSPLVEAYSANPALALRRILTDCGLLCDDATVATAANYCDEDVSGAARWEANLNAVTRRPLREWVHTLSVYGNILIDYHGNTMRLVVDNAVTSSPIITRTITEADIVAGSARTTKHGTKDSPKQVIVSYVQLDGSSRTATAGSGGSGEITRLQLPGYSTFTMAKRQAVELLNKSQADLRHTHICHDEGLADAIGDVVSLTYAPHGIGAKPMRIIGYEEVEPGRWRRELAEYDPALYSDSVFVPPSIGDTNLANPNKPPTPGGLTIVEELHRDETGTTYSRLKVTWSGSSWPYTRAYKITIDGEQRIMNQLVAHDGSGVTHTVYSDAVKQDVTYVVQLWIQSQTGALSAAPSSASVVALGKLLPPGDVPWMNVVEVAQLIQAQWGAAEEIDGDLRGYTLKMLANSYYTTANAAWSNANAITLTQRLDAQSYLGTAQVPTGNYWVCIKAVDNTGTESDNALCMPVTVTSDVWSTNYADLYELEAECVNLHFYIIDGVAKYGITSLSESWQTRFGNTSPLATWGDTVTQSPAERWGGDLATDTTFVSSIWDSQSVKEGAWYFSDANLTLYGGTQANSIYLSGETSPLSFSENVGSTIQASGRYLKAKIATTDSPATAGDGFLIELPIQGSFSGAVVPQSGTVTIANDSPLDMPKTVTFTSAYTEAPRISLTAAPLQTSPQVVVALIPVADNVTASSFDIWLFDLSGARTAGIVYWSSEGI